MYQAKHMAGEAKHLAAKKENGTCSGELFLFCCFPPLSGTEPLSFVPSRRYATGAISISKRR